MPDTVRTFSEILTLLADNTSRAISPQDLRDGIVTIKAYLPPYVATLSQSGTSAPSATAGVNFLTGASWAYVSAGRYRLTAASQFTADKTFGVANVPKDVTSGSFKGYIVRVDSSNIDLYVEDNAGAGVNGWSNVQVIIWISP